MLQDIFPKIYHNEYHEKQPQTDDFILIFDNNETLIRYEEDKIRYPRYQEIQDKIDHFVYLFSIDQSDYFLAFVKERIVLEGYAYEAISSFRTTVSKHTAFAGITAHHLYCWYRDNHFCGRCGRPMTPDHTERMLYCPMCHNMVYPRISPAVIVAITDGNRLLMSKYAGREYTKYALIAGFTEIGESVENTVRREVMEEVGLKVKNITYYKSQPWAFSGSLLLGFFAELDGSPEIHLDTSELAEAGWFTREEIDLGPDDISLTREMIMKFVKDGK